MKDLKTRREAAALTKLELAERSGVNATTIGMAENRGLKLKPAQQRAIDEALARAARARLRTLKEMAGEEVAAE